MEGFFLRSMTVENAKIVAVFHLSRWIFSQLLAAFFLTSFRHVHPHSHVSWPSNSEDSGRGVIDELDFGSRMDKRF